MPSSTPMRVNSMNLEKVWYQWLMEEGSIDISFAAPAISAYTARVYCHLYDRLNKSSYQYLRYIYEVLF